MKNNVVAPSVGESITEVSILKWAKPNGSAVKVGELLLEIETDKATVEVVAEQAGTLQIIKQVGERIPIGEIVATIDDSVAPSAAAAAPSGASASGPPPLPGGAPSIAPPAAPPSFAGGPPPLPGAGAPPRAAPPLPPSMPQSAPSAPPSFAPPSAPSMAAASPGEDITRTAIPTLSPSVRRAAASHGVNPTSVPGTGKDGRVTKGDILSAGAAMPSTGVSTPAPTGLKTPTAQDKPGDRRVPMSMLRSKIAERLVQAQHTAAILTTFNEVDMSAIMKLRAENKDAFKAKYGVNLSFMSFFAKASIAALKQIPEVNASIDGKDTVYHDYYDLGIAVGTERGLVVPVIRNADQLSFVDFEKKIAEFAVKGRDGKLSMADLTGGTFTISNGGTYGSLMSTPILNPPQSGILGMHKIMDRPIAVNGKVEIRPMMYLALSYDHRIVDGKGAVTWLVALKDHLENPEKLGFSL
jgi:2-oxoglutarate dehydrogenase E2 component (dihydrolipoamide succinyltransferase)